MNVNEDRTHAITRITKSNKGEVKILKSENNLLITSLNFKWNLNNKSENVWQNKREEICNYKNKEYETKFKDITSNTRIYQLMKKPKN